MSAVPANVGIQWPSKQAALECRRGDIHLAFCRDCAFITNVMFEEQPLEYDISYDNTLHFSQHYRAYARSVASDLISRYNLRNKDIIDIGCGRGDFLKLICELGDNRGVGFDLSHEDTRRLRKPDERLTFVQDFYSEKYADYPADLIYSQYVLEHIPNPRDFVAMIRRTIGQRTGIVMYFEVPAVGLILDQLSVWDIIFEHCSYFCPGSLSRLFVEAGFSVQRVQESYGGQFVQIEVSLSGDGAEQTEVSDNDRRRLPEAVDKLAEHLRSILSDWKERCNKYKANDSRVVLWGAGAKGVTFLNMPGLSEVVSYVIDINPRKVGKFMAGSGQEIVSPEFLKEYKPDIVILMNPVYRTEIEEQLRELGVDTQIVDV